jgi:hypothetical protein
MLNPQFELLAMLRASVGYLGEREQFAWWQSSFFDQDSSSFLAPVFARTHILAQCAGVTRAAALVHDERIGVGDAYHLFRLPEDVEQGIHRVLHDAGLGERIAAITASRAAAADFLRGLATAQTKASVGPARVGGVLELRQKGAWSTVAGLYSRAFEGGSQVYPFFADRSR